ncbi:thiamine pyrophosphate-binding protein [Hufsiella ginkgonis]|uniref:Alpha-keto acid decarboxylase family protein n=1 Tax=Hufsiella ginkgonis TaxID=2695274 RepID=A0A7K1XSA7_9SPHI|nr:thiamine pyrophosphate-binding protein [Hufsiella ginkgonis]MXV13885.1 alpha-keto acid decarboxylase family protein [Hufsiella ginkgonis]
MINSTQMTVALYLKQRLEQLGLDRMFGVAGNYTAPLLNTILEDKTSPITISRNVNEMCAGYAADGYARLKGLSALHVTYSVGAFSLLNTIAGSYTEQVSLILINGAPTNKEDAVERYAGLMYAHTTGDMVPDIELFRSITVGAERITNAVQACFQIDSVLTAMLTYKRPVYIEVTEDVWRAPCNPPQGTLSSGAGAIITASVTNQAVTATMQLLQQCNELILWAGIELQRFGLENSFLQLLETINDTYGISNDQPVHFVTSPLSKSVISENHAWFEGCVTLTQSEIQSLVGTGGCVIGLGAWTTGKDTGNQNIRSSNTIFAAHDGVWVGAVFYPLVTLESYMGALRVAFINAVPGNTAQLKGLRLTSPKLLLQKSVHAATDLNYDSFFSTLQDWITEQHTLVVDAGFPLVGAQGVKVPARDGFVAQASWLAIGYSVAAATGVKLAQPDQRIAVVMGDGAFHETCQAVADHYAYGQNNVVFVLVNGIYGIEQEIVNPNVFRTQPVNYPDRQLDSVYPYNILPSWQYSKITDAFGGEGRKATTVAELQQIMQEIDRRTDINFVVEVTIPQTAVPAAIARAIGTAVGEDEIENPAWPPVGVY